LIILLARLNIYIYIMLDKTSDDLINFDEESFVIDLINNRKLVTVFLISGIKLEGTIVSFDSDTVTLKGSNNIQLVYKHAISTILPV
ncbi:MAG: RNA chaperone Hfq, partial [Pseudomonadota bacterium]|nr:RNA chaperone Hfq [Pseudomonadota bacterium]